MGKFWFTIIGGNRKLKCQKNQLILMFTVLNLGAFQCSSFLATLLFFNIQIIVRHLDSYILHYSYYPSPLGQLTDTRLYT